MTLKTVYVSAAFLSGLFLSFYAYDLMPVFLIAILAVCGLSLFVSKELRKRLWLVSVSFALAVLFFGIYTSVALAPLERLDGGEYLFDGKIAETTFADSGKVIVEGKIDGKHCKAVAFMSIADGDIGDLISFTAKVSKFSSKGIFDERSYYLPDGIYLSLSPVSSIDITQTDSHTLSERLMLYSHECAMKIRELAGGDEGDFITAMSTGNTDSLSPVLRRNLSRSGIGHVTSVSGLHISVVSAMILYVFKKLRLSHSVCAISAVIPIAAYVVYSGGEISAIRSAVMMVMYIVAALCLRLPHLLNTLSLCSLLMVLPNPYVAADASFILSISGIFGVGIVAPYACSLLKIKSVLGKSLATSCSAWLITAPVLMLYFDEISILSPLTNLSLPLSSVAMVLTLIYVLFGCTPLLNFLPIVAGYAVKPILWISELAGEWKHSCIPVLDDRLAAVAVFIAVACVLAVTVMKNGKSRLFMAVVSLALFMAVYSVGFGLSSNRMTLHIVNSGGDSACLLTSGSSGIILDLDKGYRLSEEVTQAAIKSGVTDIKIATSISNSEAAYSEYSRAAIKPEKLILSEGSFIYDSEIPLDTLGEQTTIHFGDAKVVLSGEAIRITRDGITWVITKGLAEGGAAVSVFDGAVVINETGYTEEIVTLKL